MPKRLSSDSEGEDSNVSDDSSPVAANEGVPDYERQRLSRIAENMKRMEALGLHKMVKSLTKGSTWRSTANGKKDKGKKKKKVDEDEDYIPNSGKGVKIILQTKRTGEPRERRLIQFSHCVSYTISSDSEGEDAEVSDDSSPVAVNKGRRKINENEDPNSEKGKSTLKSKKNAGKKVQVDPDFICDDELIQGKTAHLSRTRRSLRQRNK